ncbi:esterase [Pseudomonas turukhanskensis]|uniref:Esterase n=1 Tax=Pseudomonas turukhanskensis TaxID=1806536 RepID=A0A9W6NFB6_9PSED|nr:esterase [Pseudomonas turukhanskensis]
MLTLACANAQAARLPYSNLIVFGDSLNDAGQFPDAGGPPGSSLRFTNRTGPDYANNNNEPYAPVNATLLGGKMGINAGQLGASTSVLGPQQGVPDGNNWATGGYTTQQILASITGVSSVSGAGGVVIRERPGYLASNAFAADPNALYYLNGGANDFFQGLVTNPTDAGAAGGRLADSAHALQQAGARYLMVWLLPDLGLTPLNYGTPGQTPLSQLSAAFNQALVSDLERVPAQVIPLNVPVLFSEIVASAESFGMLGTTALLSTCFSGSNCTANPTYGLGGSNPSPDKLLFNDSVHPTSAAHRIIADYAYSLLVAPSELSLLPQIASAALSAHDAALSQAWQADAGAWQPVNGWRAIANAGGQRQDYQQQRGAAEADGRQTDVQVGGSYRLSEDWRAGLLAGAYRQSLKAGDNDSRYKLDSYLASAFVQFEHEQWWADAALTGGHLDYRDLQRNIVLGAHRRAEQGDTSGTAWGAGAQLGYNLAANSSVWQLSPFLSADYSRIWVDGYREQGQRSTALTVDSQKVSSKRLGVGIRGSLQPLPGTRLLAQVAHEHEFNTDTQTVTMNQNALPTLAYRLDGYRPAKQHNRLSLGVHQQLTEQLAMQAGYSLHKTDDLSQQGVNLGLSLSF